MSVTLTSSRMGNTVTVTAATTLSGLVYFHWYLDGDYVGHTSSASGDSSRSFVLSSATQGHIDVLDTTSATFDPLANAPVAFPGTRTIFFIRSLDSSIDHYRIDQQINGGSWTTVGTVQDDARSWSYSFTVTGLLDLTNYAWRVVCVDVAGNDDIASILPLAAEKIVRWPDAPNFTAAFNAGTSKVTFTGANW